ncbi:hypothetical protein [Rhizobium sp. 12,4]|uniref:hypothetical protein n=1 Tax=Rhizobium sp. 12,4 TaxID=3405135 RepID=UPI003D33FBF1
MRPADDRVGGFHPVDGKRQPLDAGNNALHRHRIAAGANSVLQPELMQVVMSDEGLALIRAFCRIKDEKLRRRTFSLVKSFGRTGAGMSEAHRGTTFRGEPSAEDCIRQIPKYPALAHVSIRWRLAP